MSKNWDAMGLAWTVGEVSREHGGHRTDRKVIGEAYYPRIADLTKAREYFGDNTVTAWINASNSIRVMAQGINRAGIEARLSEDTIKDKIYNRLRGMRNAAVMSDRRVVIVTLVDGTIYEGSDEVEYQQLQLAAMVDLGVAPDVARERALKMVLPK